MNDHERSMSISRGAIKDAAEAWLAAIGVCDLARAKEAARKLIEMIA